MKDNSNSVELTKIGNLFDDYFRSIGQLKRFKRQMAVTYWRNIVGERVASHTNATDCQNGILFIEVDSSAWLNELQFMKREIVSQLNRYLNGNYIKDAKFLARRE